MYRIFVIASLLPVLVAGAWSAHGQAATKDTATFAVGSTRYQGGMTADGSVEFFLGVPFAQPPVGELRWRAPQPYNSKPGVLQAVNFAPACQQGTHMFEWYRDVVKSFGGDPATFPEPDVSEDCLYLNIWRPARSGAAALPVLVYIHGGSNKGGWSYEPNYLGENLARRGLIVVSIAYRLGVFGFFAHPELADANFALLDQIAALKWLNQNMESLGGDAANITVMGESAGASNIAYLLVSPAASGLFRRVIHQSAGWAVMGRTTREEHLLRGVELQKRLFDNGGSIEQMRKVPAGDLLRIAETVYEGHFFDPVVDGQSLVSSVNEGLLAQRFPPVDLLIGSNADEWLMYLEEGQSVDQWMRENLTASQAQAVKPLLPVGTDAAQTLDTLITAYNFVCPSMFLAEQVGRRGGRSWFYYFSRVREGELARSMGAYHGAELPYVFNTHDDWLPTNAADLELTQAVMDYWINFVRSGDPNGAPLPDWPLFDRKAGSVLRLDSEISALQHESLAICSILMTAGP